MLEIGRFSKSLSVALALVGTIAVQSQDVLDRLRETARERYGSKGEVVVAEWRDTIQLSKPLEIEEQLERVNDFFNQRVAWDNDLLIWGEEDYWATPLETLGVAAGDCDDFSIAKYVTLILLGVPSEKLRITYVKATLQNGFAQAHMVLAFYPSPLSEPLVLDNINPQLLPASQREDLEPVFSFNSNGIWVGNAVVANDRNPAARISRWRDFLARLQEEGIVL